MTLPAAIASAFEGITLVPLTSHWIGSDAEPLDSVTVPGVVTICGPLDVPPATPGVSTATSCDVPLVIVSQAANSIAQAADNAAIAAILRNTTNIPQPPIPTIKMQPVWEYKCYLYNGNQYTKSASARARSNAGKSRRRSYMVASVGIVGGASRRCSSCEGSQLLIRNH
jgi:hypothetical protein